jgi:hypothetical protein
MNRAGARSFRENPIHVAIVDSLKTNRMSCSSIGCRDTVHPVAQPDRGKFWRRGQ